MFSILVFWWYAHKQQHNQWGPHNCVHYIPRIMAWFMICCVWCGSILGKLTYIIQGCFIASWIIIWLIDTVVWLLEFQWSNCVEEGWINLTILINWLGPSDAIWRWRSWSKLLQVMACCLTAPSHYLNQCLLIISRVLWHSSEDIHIRRFEDINQ